MNTEQNNDMRTYTKPLNIQSKHRPIATTSTKFLHNCLFGCKNESEIIYKVRKENTESH